MVPPPKEVVPPPKEVVPPPKEVVPPSKELCNYGCEKFHFAQLWLQKFAFCATMVAKICILRNHCAPHMWSLHVCGASTHEEPPHVEPPRFHFSSFWKPWFPFQFILETLVSIFDNFGNLGFHFGSFWKPWFP